MLNNFIIVFKIMNNDNMFIEMPKVFCKLKNLYYILNKKIATNSKIN